MGGELNIQAKRGKSQTTNSKKFDPNDKLKLKWLLATEPVPKGPIGNLLSGDITSEIQPKQYWEGLIRIYCHRTQLRRFREMTNLAIAKRWKSTWAASWISYQTHSAHWRFHFSKWDSWQCGSSQSLEDPFAMLAVALPPPTSSCRLSNLFSLPGPPVLRSASFNFCLNRCLRPAEFSSCCLDCEGGAPCGPK